MVGAMEGNAAKSSIESPARILDIFNAYRPAATLLRSGPRRRGRHAGRQRDSYGLRRHVGLARGPPERAADRRGCPLCGPVHRWGRDWLDTRPNGRIVKSILNPDNSPSESRRKWYNQITGTEDAWVEPRWVDQCASRDKLEPGDRIVLFGDGSKSGDDTGLVACRVSDGFMQTLYFFHPTADQLSPRMALDARVAEIFDTYKPVAFYFDPSHAKADDTVEDDRYWWPLVDDWSRRYGQRLKHWPIQSGDRKHAVAFDMLTPRAQQLFQPAVSQLREDLEHGVVAHHGGKRLQQHMKNARKREGRYGMTVGKEHRSSSRKVDLAVCAIGARMLWRQVSLKSRNGSGSGRVVVLQ
jgi:hypothetical protein